MLLIARKKNTNTAYIVEFADGTTNYTQSIQRETHLAITHEYGILLANNGIIQWTRCVSTDYDSLPDKVAIR